VFYNPAMLSYLEHGEILGGAMLVIGDVGYRRERRGTYQRSDSLDFALPVAPDAIDRKKTGFASEVHAHPVGVAPTPFGAYALGSRIVAGLGIYAPYVAKLSVDPAGAQRFALQDANIVSLFVTPSASLRVTDALSIGAGISYVLGYAELTRVQDFAGLA